MIRPGLARPNSFPFLPQRVWLLLSMLGMAAYLSGTATPAQDNSAQSPGITTLHVSTNLVHIPVLVLTPAYEKLPSPVAQGRFSISLDGGPSFRPRYVRQEGDDPIDLAIVVDARAPQEGLLPKIDEAIADLAPNYLRASDRVSIYVIDCSTINAMEDVPADRVQLRNAVDVALRSWTERRQFRKKPPCSANTHLWDDLAYVTKRLSGQAGWRAIVAVTDGNDRKSKHSSDELTTAAQNSQVTIFALDPFQEGPRGVLSTDLGVMQLTNVCESSGGLRLGLYQSTAAKRMRQFTEMLRGRYILEFPRPPNLKAGNTPMLVRIDNSNAFIRPAGDGVPVTDQGFTVDPTPVPETVAK